MATDRPSAYGRTAAELEHMLCGDRPRLPELERGRPLDGLDDVRWASPTLIRADALLADAATIPQTTYSRYKAFERHGERDPYEAPYVRKRETLNAAVLRFLMGRRELKDTIHDYLWLICDESTWVLPAHDRVIDLMAAETALALAETIYLLRDDLDAEVRRRVHREIDARVLTPFLHGHMDLRWFEGHDNWNGVCSGAIGGAFLYLEPDPARLALAVALLLRSLETYLATAFEQDGGTTEGMGYWHYGLSNVVIFAEMLRSRSDGAIDLLASPRLREIAAVPAKMLLPNQRFVTFSDCPRTVPISPGIVTRLAERTGKSSLLALLSPASTLAHHPGGPLGLRTLLWWDGRRHAGTPAGDALLPATGIARLADACADGAPIVLLTKAGHNDENHNHNDVGSFVLNVDGEDMFTDPGPGRVDRDYFDDNARYRNVFANSDGHSVPRIDGQPQGSGRSFAGTIHEIVTSGDRAPRAVRVDFTRAYPVQDLANAYRELTLDPRHGVIWLEDVFHFAHGIHEVNEALVTWLPVRLDGATAVIEGHRHHLRLGIEEPAGVAFELDTLEEESRANAMPAVLQRVRIHLTDQTAIRFRLRMEVMPITPPEHGMSA